MKISKQDFEIVFYIEFMNYNYPIILSQKLEIDEKEAEKKLFDLEKRGIIKLEYRNKKIYGSQLTEKGKKIFNDDNYMPWKLELGY